MLIKKSLKKFAIKLACHTVLKPKNTQQNFDDVPIIECGIENVSFLTHSTNNLIRISVNGKIFYFRECKKHEKIKEFIRERLNFYYSYCAPEYAADKNFVLKSLSVRKSLKKFVNMGIVNDCSSGAYHFCIGDGGKYIGLETDDITLEERLKDMVQFIWGDLYAYMLNSGVKIGNYEIYNAVRSISTYRIAKLLNIERLIPNTRFVTLHIAGMQTMFGTLMEQAAGRCLEHASPEERIGMVSPELQRDLITLNYLDVICLERDHRLGNYNVVFEKGIAKGVIAFDNDSPRSFSIGGISFFTYKGCSPLFKGKKYNRSFVDAELELNLQKLTFNRLHKELGNLLNVWQLIGVWSRIKKLKQLIRRIPIECKLLKDEWSDETVKIELKDDFGKTYLKHFIEKQDIPYQPWIK